MRKSKSELWSGVHSALYFGGKGDPELAHFIEQNFTTIFNRLLTRQQRDEFRDLIEGRTPKGRRTRLLAQEIKQMFPLSYRRYLEHSDPIHISHVDCLGCWHSALDVYLRRLLKDINHIKTIDSPVGVAV
jgi:hypothetical protein